MSPPQLLWWRRPCLPVDVVDTNTVLTFKKTLKNLSVSLRLPQLIRLPSASASVEYTALYKFFFDQVFLKHF